MLKTLIPGVVRTLVPALVAFIIALAAKANIHLDSEALEVVVEGIVTLGLTGVYYVGVRILERFRSSKWGWLLGYPAQPVYVVVEPASEELEKDFI